MSYNMNPDFRHLRAYAFDPSLSLEIDRAKINRTTYVPDWEKDLKPGPCGEYIEVIDYLPICDEYISPIDLNDSHVLAENGLSPIESNPQFHQQMVYAVAVITIQNYEKALGRKVVSSLDLIN